MYEAYFQMKKRPFAATPVADVYFPAKPIETARLAISRTIERAGGPAVVLGPSGTGKSLLLAKLAQAFTGKFDIVQLTGGRLRTVRALLQNILFELKLPFRDMSEGDLRLSLLDRLEPRDRTSGGLLLLVDEAHVLPAKLLDEMRMITNLVRGGQPRARLVLAGDVRLEERLANPRLASFQQRLAARCYLQPFTKAETSEYIRHQVTQCGANAAVFAEEGFSVVQRVTDGVPRLINQLCDHALVLSCVAGEHVVTAQRLEEAWADLQQLPAPAATIASAAPSTSSVIEFGTLDDAPPSTEKVTRFDGATVRRRDPIAQLDAIEEQIAAANHDDFSPLALQPSELELTFEVPMQPFGTDFEEEEVLIDRYASLEAKTLRNRPRVSSSEGRAIAALLGTSSPARQQLGIVSDEVVAEAPQMELDAEAFEDPFDPASDPVMPDVATNVAQVVNTPELVVIDAVGDSHPSPPVEPQGRVHRQEYRQLFARLRRGG